MNGNGSERPHAPSTIEPILQACPFCGGWSIVPFGEDDEDETFCGGTCHTCNSYGPTIWMELGCNDCAEVFSSQAWNIRGGPPELLSPARRGEEPDERGRNVKDHKPCPWCASRTLFVEKTGSSTTVVNCGNCGASGPWENLLIENPYDRLRSKIDEKTAWALWDRRPGPTKMPTKE